MAITRGSKSSTEEPAQTLKINAQLLLDVKKYVVSQETLENRLTIREFVEQAVMDRLKKINP